MASETGLWMGIDIGTTSLKVSVLDGKGKEIFFESKDYFRAGVISDIGEAGFEQRPKALIEQMNCGVVPFARKYKDHILGIGITGQMHGLVLWKHLKRKSGLQELTPDSGGAVPDFAQRYSIVDRLDEFKTSHLYTWQDQRCTPQFLATLPAVSDPHQPLATGHGCATLFWLLDHDAQALEEVGYTCCGTIMDLATSLICDLQHPVTSEQLAASMGYFHGDKLEWDSVLQNTAKFPYHMMPKIVEAGTCIGRVSEGYYGWPAGVPVFVGMGDVQCAMYSLMQEPSKAILNIGTSIQLGFLSKSSDVPNLRSESPPSISFFPFFRPYHLALCAGLNGGNAVQHFVECLSAWLTDLGCSEKADVQSLFTKLQAMAERHDSLARNAEMSSLLSVRPSFFGERHDPTMGASISGITLGNFSNIGHVFRRLCEGLIHHLCSMVPPSFLLARGVNRLSVCGSVPGKNRFVRLAINEDYGVDGLRVEVAQSWEQEMSSAKGAAQIVKDFVSRSSD